MVMFSAWGIKQEVIAMLLTNRRAAARSVLLGQITGLLSTVPQYERTEDAVQARLARIRKDHPEFKPDHGPWNREAAAAYLDQSPVDRAIINYSSLHIKTLLHSSISRSLNSRCLSIVRCI